MNDVLTANEAEMYAQQLRIFDVKDIGSSGCGGVAWCSVNWQFIFMWPLIKSVL